METKPTTLAQPLLGGPATAGAPKAAPVPKKEEPKKPRFNFREYCRLSSPPMIFLRRGLTLFVFMAISVYLGVAAACTSMVWPKGIWCQSSGVSCTTTKYCQDNVWGISTCFANKCVEPLSGELHPICVGKCTPTQMATVFDICIVIVLLALLWVGGEFVIRSFDVELQEDIKSGRERQQRMNKRDKIDVDAIVKSVRHSWQWNDELEGWKERKNLQKERFAKNIKMRAYGFYFMYAFVAFLVILLIVGFISPKQPAAAVWPEWTIEYVLGQLESLQTMEFEAFYFWLVLTQFLLEVGLFMAAAIMVRWPQAALVRSKDLVRKAHVNKKKAEKEAAQLNADEP